MRILPMLFALVLLPNPATAQSYYHLQPDGSGSTDIIWCTFSGNACENGAVIPFESSVTPHVHNQADPQFCSPIPDDHENWTLQEDSLCTALNSGAGMRIGAYSRACGTVSRPGQRVGAHSRTAIASQEGIPWTYSPTSPSTSP